MRILLCVIAIFAVLASTQVTNCVIIAKHQVKWRMERDLVHFDVTIFEGAKGWAAIGLGPTDWGMSGMNQVMTYFKNGVTHINEYFSEVMMGQPTLYKEPLMTNAAAVVHGEGFKIRFSRPLAGQNRGYFRIRPETMKIVIALNWDTVPVNSEDWFVHSAVDTKEVNLFQRHIEC
jgi:hypothetical protein